MVCKQIAQFDSIVMDQATWQDLAQRCAHWLDQPDFTALAPDGPQNLLHAMAVVQDPAARGVLVACAGRIHNARNLQKVHPYRLDAFSAGETGPRAFIEQGRVRWCVSGDWPVVVHAYARRALADPAANWPKGRRKVWPCVWSRAATRSKSSAKPHCSHRLRA